MPNSIAARLASLPNFSKTDLHNLWKELFQNQPPPKLRKDLMVPVLGYKLQEVSVRQLSASATKKLSQTADAINAHRSGCSTDIKPGTRLVRQWRSEMHVVHVEEQGYEYNGSRYDSLSKIARLITGSRCSGPLFFGLKSKRTRDAKEKA
jgi:Protein of unknown function (DUF2924)